MDVLELILRGDFLIYRAKAALGNVATPKRVDLSAQLFTRSSQLFIKPGVRGQDAIGLRSFSRWK